jgi:hypothetical protein
MGPDSKWFGRVSQEIPQWLVVQIAKDTVPSDHLNQASVVTLSSYSATFHSTDRMGKPVVLCVNVAPYVQALDQATRTS